MIELVITIAATWVFVASTGRIVDADEVPSGSTALVLGSLVRDDVPGDYVRGRLDTTVDLYRDGRLVRIINSGNGSVEAGNEPAVMRRYLEDRGVASSVITDDPDGRDTDASCRRAHDVFGVRRAVIITQDFHLSRAIALCRRRGVDAVGVAARCDCAVWTVARNHLREAVLARPRALLGAVVQ
ncbi:ElyC/SanA/YdcF family protein [Gordonia sp. CPCC 206044]|uniref:SanA/YdcF family protein n=1 Tax=Gordonia sp. CPCC 206044 TaxID=3140793 RepID=UPI003AF345FC